ncbi:type II toxin-antitoxin system YoeB family toxin [Nocardiopsis sp. NPDC055551]|uniref:type II toxin-antitoxin system YoeB family toxin n=1 Tax=Nocardiopsis sp. NPDC006832 TaxID=3157188 RepID=UPI0033DBC504
MHAHESTLNRGNENSSGPGGGEVRTGTQRPAGRPGPLRHGFQSYWSRRITDEHRLVHKLVEEEIRIATCRHRYGK